MKQIVNILIILAYSISSIKAQTNRYDKPASATFINTYVSPDWNNLNKAYEYERSIHDRNAQIIDNMINGIYSLKSQTDNQSFKQKLDEYLVKLKNLRLGSMVNAESEIKKIDWALRDEIEKYNSGSYAVPNKISSSNEVVFSYGSYVETIPDRPIRDNPEPYSKEISNTNSVKFVLIKGMPNDNFYTIEYDYVTGYISKEFLLQYASREAYNEFYLKNQPQTSQKESQSIHQISQESSSKQDYASTNWNARSRESYKESYRIAFVTSKDQEHQFIVKNTLNGSIELILITSKSLLEESSIYFQFDDSKENIRGNLVLVSNGSYKCVPFETGGNEYFIRSSDLSRITIDSFITYLRKYNKVHINVYSSNQYASKSFDYYFTLVGASVNLNWVLASDFK